MKRGRRTGMSLVELLIALTVSALVIAVIFAIYRTASGTTRWVEQDKRVFGSAIAAVDAVSRDLTCAINIPLAGSVSLTLNPAPPAEHAASALLFYTVTVPYSDDGSDQFQVMRVSYRLRPGEDGSEDGLTLVRETQVVQDDGSFGAPYQEDIAGHVEDFRVMAYDGDNWCDAWPAQGRASALPRGARISLSCRAGRMKRTFQSTAFIRSGMML